MSEIRRSPLHKHQTKRPAGPRSTELEQLVETVLNRYKRTGEQEIAQEVLDFDTRGKRVVILGGGTGLSTVVGGNSQMPDWPEHPFVGLKEEFVELDVVVCTTDDGGSSGQLLKQLPMIAIGDLRKSFVSMVRLAGLSKRYHLSGVETLQFARLLQQVFHYRFPSHGADTRLLENPLLAAPSQLRASCPPPLASELRALGNYVSPRGAKLHIHPAGHCLGNLLLTAAIFREAGGDTGRPPSLRHIRKGLDRLCGLVGVSPGRLHPATATPGQLRFHYANGVEVRGQSKSALARRGFPVEWLAADYVEDPVADEAVLEAIGLADLILYAPGSLYTSIIPILQLPRIVQAIRKNRKALKILGANFWIQEGETDISPRQAGRGFLVSDLIEAYDRNVPGGAKGLFQIVLSANLERIPGNILRSYALEGKSPIHLDRQRVESMGFQPVEATLFKPDFAEPAAVIHHDAGRFALAIRSMLYAWSTLKDMRNLIRRRIATAGEPRPVTSRLVADKHPSKTGHRIPLLCAYLNSIEEALEAKEFRPRYLKDVLRDIAWENRDIRPEHLAYFRGAQGIPAGDWDRSTAWDNVLGYYDPEDRTLKVHRHVLEKPDRLREELLTALGESLLGRYIESRAWREFPDADGPAVRRYEIRLRPQSERMCYLNDRQLRTYLELARLVPDAQDKMLYHITLNHVEGFLPPGLLFGLTYAWYLDNKYARAMEYEMSVLGWRRESLIPHQEKERVRKNALVAFFCAEVFGHARG